MPGRDYLLFSSIWIILDVKGTPAFLFDILLLKRLVVEDGNDALCVRFDVIMRDS